MGITIKIGNAPIIAGRGGGGSVSPPPIIITDGVTAIRKLIRDGCFVVDKTLTPLGFAGVKTTDGGLTGDWKEVKSTILPNVIVFDDWFLPSKDEWKEIYDELILYDVGGFLGNGSYWTSSEWADIPTSEAWLFDVAYGDFGGYAKNSNHQVRAIRSFNGNSGDYAIRDIGPAGGYIFAYSGGKYFETASSDCSDSTWSNIINLEVITSMAIGSGQTNTTAIISQVGHITSAAKFCNDL